MNKKSLLAIIISALLIVAFTACETDGNGNGTCTHNWGSWNVTTATTCINTGTGTRNCTKCDVLDTNTTIPAKGHSYSETWSSDETDHWKECDDCGDEKDKANHTFDDGECTVCGYVDTSQFVIESKYSFTDGFWLGTNDTLNGTVTVGENSITTSTAGINITGVYTAGGGNFYFEDGGDLIGTWAYLYNAGGKIGVIALFTYWDDAINIYLGKSFTDENIDNGNIIEALGDAIDTTDMLDTYSGLGVTPSEG